MKKAFCLSILCVISVLIFPASAQAEKIYSVGVVPQFDVRRITEIWQPILDEVSKRSGIRLELHSSPGIPEFEKQFNAGEFDFAYMNPYHVIVANKNQGYMPVLRDTGRSLFGIIVVRKDSPITSVKELDGKTVAYPAPNALGASLIPRAEFSNKFNIKVNELYVKSHSSVYLNVILGKTEAGGGILKTLSEEDKEIQDQLRVLYKTTEVPPHPITAHPRVDKEIVAKVAAAFLDMAKSDSGKSLLSKIPMKKIGVSTLDDYNPLRSMGLEKFYVTD